MSRRINNTRESAQLLQVSMHADNLLQICSQAVYNLSCVRNKIGTSC
jgi:hypothetical protein